MSQTALIIAVPEAEPLVREIRERYDPAALFGVPAHVSVLYPFMAPGKIEPAILDRLDSIFSTIQPFAFRLEEVQSFPETLYLLPEPASRFVSVIKAVCSRFPDYPPYGGDHDSIAPHLTLAFRHKRKWKSIRADLQKSLEPGLAIESVCNKVTLIENSTGYWQDMHEFWLGEG